MTSEGQRMRRSAGNLTQRDLIRFAESLGWTVSTARGKGSHAVAMKAGEPRSVTIPIKVKRRIALAIIRQLEGASDG